MINSKVFLLPFVVDFHCREKIGRKFEEWDGCVESIHNYGSHYEIHVESRSGFIFMVGNYAHGSFISIPAFGVGCDLSSYGDYFWNNAKLARLMNPVDAATIAEALRTMYKNNYL